MRRKLATAVVSLGMLAAGGVLGEDGGADGGEVETDTVSAAEYATGMCGAIVGWIDDIQRLNADLQANLDPTASLDSLKDMTVGFLGDVTDATDAVIDEVEALGVPDVEDGQAAADTVLAFLRDSRDVFVDARESVQGLSTADPAAFGTELETIGNDIQTSMSGIGNELGQLDSSELDEASEDVPECEAGGLGRVEPRAAARILGGQLHMGVYWLRAGRVSPGRSGPRSGVS